MAVTAIQDGQKSIHAAAISGFSAAESNLTAESHALAETMLNPQPGGYAKDTCVVDGAPCLSEAASKHYEGINIARCRGHLRKRLLTTANGRESLPLYDKIVLVPSTRKAYADELFSQLPKDSPLLDIPREQICDAYLPDGVDNHGVRLNNPAEILNWMMSKGARVEESHFRSMMAVEELLSARQAALEAEVKKEKLKQGVLEGASSANRHDSWRKIPWLESASIPKVYEMNESLRTRSLSLADPTPTRTGEDEGSQSPPVRFTVPSDADPRLKFKVDLDAFQKAKYDKACACGMTSSSWVRGSSLSFSLFFS